MVRSRKDTTIGVLRLFPPVALASFGQETNTEAVLRLPLAPIAIVIFAGLTACKGKGGSETATKPASEMARGQMQQTSFDCSGSLTPAAKMVCEDAQLAALDREAARLQEFAASSPKATAERTRSLQESQQVWQKGRDDCEHSRDAKQCITAAYAERIHELRKQNADLRAESGGISHGPMLMECAGLESGVSVTFLDADPNLAYFEWMENYVVLPQISSASGAKYSGQFHGQPYSLWTKGNEALFQRPGGPEAKCTIKSIE